MQKLEKRELIEKRRSLTDKRRLEVLLTPKGRIETAAAPSSLQSKFTQKFKELPTWEQHQIAGVLGKVTQMLGADTLEAAPILDIGPLDQKAH